LVSALGFIALLAFWLAYATINTIFKDQMLALKEQRLYQARLDYEARIARLRRSIDQLNGKLMLDQDAWLARVDEVRKDYEKLLERQKLLQQFLTRSGLVATGKVEQQAEKPRDGGTVITPAGGESGKGSMLSRDRLRASDARRSSRRIFSSPFRTAAEAERPLSILGERFRRLEAMQVALLDEAASKAQQKLAQIRKLYQKLSLDPEKVAATTNYQPEAVGGPFIPLLARDRGATPLVERMNRISTILGEVETLRHEFSRLPVTLPMKNYTRISSRFGVRRDPFRRVLALHAGIDFKAPYAAPVLATGPGEVVRAGWSGSYGKLVEIRHDNGLVTRYAHLSRVLVRVGDKVVRGQPIGRLGNTGRSTGAHLHYETRLNGRPMDPARFWKARNDLSQIKTKG